MTEVLKLQSDQEEAEQTDEDAPLGGKTFLLCVILPD